MILRATLAATVFAFFQSAHAQPPQSLPGALAGSWKIVKVLPTPNVQCWDAERARTLIGTTLSYAPGRLTWHGGSVAVSDAFSRRLSRRGFAAEYKLELAALGIRGETVEEIDLQHEDADITGATTEVPGDAVLLAGPGRIVFSVCGVYYSALKAAR